MSQPRARPNLRPDHNGTQRAQFESHKKKIYATQTVCGICGKPVDFGMKFPHPLSPCIDHIIPVSKGGHPSDIGNLQLAHMCCNRQKSDKLVEKQGFEADTKVIDKRQIRRSIIDGCVLPRHYHDTFTTFKSVYIGLSKNKNGVNTLFSTHLRRYVWWRRSRGKFCHGL